MLIAVVVQSSNSRNYRDSKCRENYFCFKLWIKLNVGIAVAQLFKHCCCQCSIPIGLVPSTRCFTASSGGLLLSPLCSVFITVVSLVPV